MRRWMMVGLLMTGCAGRQTPRFVGVADNATDSCPTVQEYEELGLPDSHTYAGLMGWTELDETAEDAMGLFTEAYPAAVVRHTRQLNDEPASDWVVACTHAHYLSLFSAVVAPPADFPPMLLREYNRTVSEVLQPLADNIQAKALHRAELALQSNADWAPRAERLADTLRQ